MIDPVDRFVAYINERYLIRARRLAGHHAPWTKDPILATYKFCNVKRKWDWTSQWLRSNWYEPNLSGPGSEYLGVAASLARFIGYVPTLEEIGYPSRLANTRTQRVLARRLAAGEKAYTGAYMLKSDGRPKPEYTVDMVMSTIARGVWTRQWDSAFALHARLMELPGWGGFMAQEVLLDVADTWLLPRSLPDVPLFAYAGPGAQRGLNRLAGRPVGLRVSQDQSYGEMKALWLDLSFRRPNVPPQRALHPELRRQFTVHDVEFNLCEFDKYERTRLGEGRPRSKFTPRA